MPARGERSAPSFDQSRPRELIRFFKELELLFVRASVTREDEKKEQVLRYVEFEVEELWQALPEFKNPLANYDEFKAAILSYYPDASGDFIYSLCDMELLIGERQQIGINTINELADFHLRFFAITSWLIEKEHLSNLEQRRAYVRAFPPSLMSLVTNRLQMKFLDHHPNIPHDIKNVYEAALYILRKSASAARNYFAPIAALTATTPPVPATDPPIKIESFKAIFAELTKTIVDGLNQSRGQQTDSSSFNRNNRNHNQSAAAHLPHATDKASFPLSPDDYIAQIEAELYALRTNEASLVSAACTRAQKVGNGCVYDPNNRGKVPAKFSEKEIAPKVIVQQVKEERRVSSNDPAAPTIIPALQSTITNQSDLGTEHLFGKARNAAYSPSTERNSRVSIPVIGTTSETVVKTVYPVCDDFPMDAICQRFSEVSIPIVLQYSLSSAFQSQTHNVQVTATCKEPIQAARAFWNLLPVVNDEASDLSAIFPTSVDTENGQLCLGDSRSFPVQSATSFGSFDKISQRNMLVASISDLPTISDSTCDPCDRIADPAKPIIPATLNLSLENSNLDDYHHSCTFSDKHRTPSDFCDLIISKLDSRNTTATSNTSKRCDNIDICDNDLDQKLQIIRDIASDPFEKVPTLDPNLTPYVPNGCYKQDRRIIFNMFIIHTSRHIIHVLRKLLILLCVYIQVGNHHNFHSFLVGFHSIVWFLLQTDRPFERIKSSPYFSDSDQWFKRYSVLMTTINGY